METESARSVAGWGELLTACAWTRIRHIGSSQKENSCAFPERWGLGRRLCCHGHGSRASSKTSSRYRVHLHLCKVRARGSGTCTAMSIMPTFLPLCSGMGVASAPPSGPSQLQQQLHCYTRIGHACWAVTPRSAAGSQQLSFHLRFLDCALFPAQLFLPTSSWGRLRRLLCLPPSGSFQQVGHCSLIRLYST